MVKTRSEKKVQINEDLDDMDFRAR